MKHSKDTGRNQEEMETPLQQPEGEQPGQVQQAAETQDTGALEEALRRAEAQRDEYLNMAQRVQADFDNFRRRNASVRSEAFDDGAAAFIKTILPVCDNFERALEQESSD